MAVQALVWTCVGVFIATSIITLLALVGKIELGGGDGTKHHGYLRMLFTALIVEVLAVGIVAFGRNVGANTERLRELDALTDTITLQRDSVADELRRLAVERDSLQERLAVAADTARSAPQALTDRITRDFRVSSEGPRRVAETIAIPDGWEYVDHSVRNTSSNGDVSRDVELVRDSEGTVTGVRVELQSGSRSVFGPRSWLATRVSIDVRATHDPQP